MDVTGAVINITSAQPERLGAWYRDVLELSRAEEMGEWAFRAGSLELIIDGHSETRGAAVEPSRFLVNLFVADIAAERDRLAAAGGDLPTGAGAGAVGRGDRDDGGPGRELRAAGGVQPRLSAGSA